jgi:hypothetical protein
MHRRFALVLLLVALVTLPLGCDDAGVDPLAESLEMAEEAPPVEAPVPAELLTPADVESVSGLTGLKVVPYDPAIGAGGEVNIADESGQLVAMLVVAGPDIWDAWLTDGFTVREPVTPPVGDESFIGPSPDVSDAVYIFGFLKGENAIAVDTFFAADGNGTILTTEQLRELAEIVESRL